MGDGGNVAGKPPTGGEVNGPANEGVVNVVDGNLLDNPAGDPASGGATDVAAADPTPGVCKFEVAELNPLLDGACPARTLPTRLVFPSLLLAAESLMAAGSMAPKTPVFFPERMSSAASSGGTPKSVLSGVRCGVAPFD